MLNLVQADSDVLTLVAPSGGVVAGTPYNIGSLVVVAVTTAAQGEYFAARKEGVVTLPKSNAAFAAGVLVEWHVANGNLVANAGGQFDVGHVVEAVGTSDTTVKVCLIGHL